MCASCIRNVYLVSGALCRMIGERATARSTAYELCAHYPDSYVDRRSFWHGCSESGAHPQAGATPAPRTVIQHNNTPPHNGSGAKCVFSFLAGCQPNRLGADCTRGSVLRPGSICGAGTSTRKSIRAHHRGVNKHRDRLHWSAFRRCRSRQCAGRSEVLASVLRAEQAQARVQVVVRVLVLMPQRRGRFRH